MSDPSHRPRPVAVPAGRLHRMARLGGLATQVAGAVALGGAKALAGGARPQLRDLVLTPGNIERLTQELAQMRGAAMKVGQLISLEAGDLLPTELTAILSRLRSDAHQMPPQQLKQVLNAAWGQGWQRQFARFDVRSIAAASIGQVHRARLKDGRDLAVKVQYPGVAQSIDSDVANVGALLRAARVLPKGFDLAPIWRPRACNCMKKPTTCARARSCSGSPAIWRDRSGSCCRRFMRIGQPGRSWRCPMWRAARWRI